MTHSEGWDGICGQSTTNQGVRGYAVCYDCWQALRVLECKHERLRLAAEELLRVNGLGFTSFTREIREPGCNNLQFQGVHMNDVYRKRPVTVHAFQMTRERGKNNSDWPDWLHKAWIKDRNEPGAVYRTNQYGVDGTLSICTLEGEHLVSWDDWIVQGIKGELYPCKPDIFNLTYELVAAPCYPREESP